MLKHDIMDSIPLYIPHMEEGEIQIKWSELNDDEYNYYWCDELLEIIQNLLNQHPDATAVHLNEPMESDPPIYDGYIDTPEGKVGFECEDEYSSFCSSESCEDIFQSN